MLNVTVTDQTIQRLVALIFSRHKACIHSTYSLGKGKPYQNCCLQVLSSDNIQANDHYQSCADPSFLSMNILYSYELITYTVTG